MKQYGNDEQKGVKKKGFLMREEMEMLDMKRRCEVIQEKLRMLSCIAVNEGSVREIKSVFLEEGKDEGGDDDGNNNICGGGGGGSNNNIKNDNNGEVCCSSGEEDNLSDLADELVEVFELDKKDKKMEDDDNGMGFILKECESENVEMKMEGEINETESGVNKGEILVVNDNNKEILQQHPQQIQQDKVIDINNNNITTPTKHYPQQQTKPILIQEQPSHNIIEITSTQPPLSSIPPPSFPHFTSSISIVSQLSTTIPANPPKQQQQQPIQPELPPDDDTIIQTILETAQITESSPIEQQQTPSSAKKKVTFDPTRTFIIEYNENELITHLSVFNADYLPMKYKPKVVKNYKQITKNGVKPCINPEYTKYLKLNVKTMPKLGCNVVNANANKKGNTCNSSRNLSSKKMGGVVKNETFTNIKRNINLNNTNNNGKVNKTNNAMNTSMTKQQMKGSSKGNSVRMDKTTDNNVSSSNSNSNKKVNKTVINKNEHNNNNKHKEQNIIKQQYITPIYEEDIDNDDDDDDDDNDEIYQSTRRYSL